jgi:glutaminyl-peptide cyclotransferase
MKPSLPRSTLLFLLAGFLLASNYCDNRKPPPIVMPHIISTLPHDSAAFTQGLFFDQGFLYESDGLYEESALRSIDAKNGSTIKRIALAPNLFAEGCTKSGNDLVQLTWREQRAFIYDLKTITKHDSLIYAGEGWGLASDGNQFFMSDGSDTITVRNKDFSIMTKLPIRNQGIAVTKLNELEWANHKLYANIWYSDRIAEIDPKSGRVLRWIDCSSIVQKEKPSSPDHVLNGIAFDAATGNFYITGKKWKNYYLVRLD